MGGTEGLLGSNLITEHSSFVTMTMMTTGCCSRSLAINGGQGPGRQRGTRRKKVGEHNGWEPDRPPTSNQMRRRPASPTAKSNARSIRHGSKRSSHARTAEGRGRSNSLCGGASASITPKGPKSDSFRCLSVFAKGPTKDTRCLFLPGVCAGGGTGGRRHWRT